MSEGLVVVVLFVWLTLDVGWEVTWMRLEGDGRVRRRRGGEKWSRKGKLQEVLLFGFGCKLCCMRCGWRWLGRTDEERIYL